MKRVAQLGMAALLLANSVPAAAQSNEASLQKSGSAASTLSTDGEPLAGSMNRALAIGLIQGDPDGKLRAKEAVTRQELAVILAKALQLHTVKPEASPFSDVPSSSWAAASIQAVKQAGLMQGYGKGDFRPKAQVTGQEFIAVLVKAFGLMPLENKAALPENWAGTSAWAVPYVQAVLQADLFSEYEGQSKTSQGLVREEAIGMLMSAMFPEQRVSEIQRISGKEVRINGVPYRISDQVAGLLNEQNKDILDQAGIRFESETGTITKITALEIRTGGEEAHKGEPEFNRNLSLQGNDIVIYGDVTVKSDFVSIEGLGVEGSLVIDPKMEHDFYARNITVKKDTVVLGGDSNTVVFEDSALGSILVNKQEVHVALTGDTVSPEMKVESDSTIEVGDAAKLSALSIEEGASQVDLQGFLQAVHVETSQSLELTGNATIQQLVVNGSGSVAIQTSGSIQQLQVNHPDSQVSVGGNISVANVSLGAGVSPSSVTGAAGSAAASATASGSSGGSSSTVTENRAPELLKSFEQRKLTSQGQELAIDLLQYVTDPDGDPLSFLVTSSKSSVVKAVLTGSTLELVPLDGGKATITVTSNDGRGKRLRSTFDVNVNKPPLASEIPDQQLVAESGEKSLDLATYFTDDEKSESELIYSVTNNDEDIVKAEVDGTELRLNPIKAGEASLKVKVDDGQIDDIGKTGVVEVTVRVVVQPPPNRAPVGEAPEDIHVYLGDKIPEVKLNERYADPDGDALTYTVSSSDETGVKVEGDNGTLTLTALQTGTYTINYSLDDGKGGITQGTFSVNVHPALNQSPTGESPGRITKYTDSLAEPVTLNLNDYYTDPDGDSLTFTILSSKPEGLAISENAGELSMTAQQYGEYTIDYRVDDDRGGYTSSAFVLRIDSVPNAAPILNESFPSQTLFVGKADKVIDLEPYFSDPDGDELTFHIPLYDDLLSFAEMKIEDKKLVIHPKKAKQFQIEVTAKDVKGKEVKGGIDVSILESGSIHPIPDQNVAWPWSLLDLDLTPYLIDFDLDSLTVEAESSNEGIATVDIAGPKVLVTPVAEGQATVTMTVYDQAGRNEQTSFMVNVQGEHAQTNTPPEAVSVIMEQVLTPGVTNDRQFDLDQLFSDADGDALHYTIGSSSAEAVDATIQGNRLLLKPGTGNQVAPLTIIAKDGKGGEGSYTFNVRTASLVNGSVLQVTTKNGVIDPLLLPTTDWFPGQTSFTMYQGTLDSTFIGPNTVNSTQISLDVSPLLTWIVGNDGRAVIVQVTPQAQGSPEAFFSQYADAGDGRSVVQLYYKGNGTSAEATGYQIEVYRWMKKTSKLEVSTQSILKVIPSMPYIFINTIFYDFFDITAASYYNDDLPLYNPDEYSVIALVLKKDGNIVDVLGDPSSHDPFMPEGGTIIRKRGIYTGSKQFSLPGEWNRYPKGTLQFITNHTL